MKFIGTIFFFIDLAVAFILVIRLMNTSNMEKRGTNAVTRFVRNSAANGEYTLSVMAGAACTVVFCLLGAIVGCFWAGLPTLIPIIMSFVFKSKSRKDDQRVKDARVVTRGTLETVDAVGGEVGAAAGAATAVIASRGKASKMQIKAAAAVGRGAGQSIGAVSGKAAKQMNDVESLGVTKEDMKGASEALDSLTEATVNTGLNEIQVPNEQAFLDAAKRVGLAGPEDNDVQLVAQKVYALIPEVAKERMKDKTEGEQAMLFLEGKV